MKDRKDTYKTISKSSGQVLHKDKKSKFFGYAIPILEEDEVKPFISSLREKHRAAGHVCYAWQLGIEKIRYRANDDGEPNHSAGMPIYGQIQSFELTNVLVAVVRIYGGIKLGVGGLINAYRTTARMALENAQIAIKTETLHFRLSFEYPMMDQVMRIIKQKRLRITSQELEIACSITIAVPRHRAKAIHKIFSELFGVSIALVST